jgi:hypothetical protein
MPLEFEALLHNVSRKIEPWPRYRDGISWYFKISFPGKTVAEIKAKLAVVEDEIANFSDFWLDGERTCPVNCTVPELLRNLYHFPMRQNQWAHLDALAFSPKEIGEARYNRAQAALRRAGRRLEARELVLMQGGQTHSLFNRAYQRSSIGLTDQGVAVADKLLTDADQAAQADLGVRAPEGEDLIG